MSRTYTIAK